MVAGVGELSERVMALVAEQTGRERAVITPDTEIERDLGCTADEACELLERMEREFGIDMRGLQPNRHFDTAGSIAWPLVVVLVVGIPMSLLLTPIVGLFVQAIGLGGSRITVAGGMFGLVYLACVLSIGFVTTVLPRLRARRIEKVPVTVQMLIEAAILGRWPTGAAEGGLE